MTDQSAVPFVSLQSGSFVVAGVIVLLLLITFSGVLYLYKSTYPSIDDINENEFKLFKIRIDTEGEHNAPRVIEAFDRQRYDTVRYVFDIQESFWSSFLQAVISLFVIGFIVILLVMGTIQAQAGLPIIAAIGGAAIGRGGTTYRAQPRSVPEHLPDPGKKPPKPA